mmetsp:Transcript_24991/g.62388  ORF Transcript_24991/g.62388 Transcript_24991/m.62388 type:complete len:262 (-) Transcript_24991:885-1670(-)
MCALSHSKAIVALRTPQSHSLLACQPERYRVRLLLLRSQLCGRALGRFGRAHAVFEHGGDGGFEVGAGRPTRACAEATAAASLNHQRDLPPGFSLRKLGDGVIQRSPPKLLVHLCHLTAHRASAPTPQHSRGVLQGSHQLVRRHKRDQRPRCPRESLEPLPPLARLGGQEPDEGVDVGGEAGGDERCCRRAGARHRHHGDALTGARCRQVRTWVRHCGRAGVADQRQSRAQPHFVQHGFAPVPLVVCVIADEVRVYAVPRE